MTLMQQPCLAFTG